MRLPSKTVPFLALLLAPWACQSPEEAAAEADRAAYSLVEARRARLFADETPFSIEAPEDSLRRRILDGAVEDVGRLSILDCLEIAAENNREYQSRKESLYLAALDVTLERWRLGYIADAGAAADLVGVGDEGQSASAGADASLSRLLGSGARIVAGIGLGMLRLINVGDDWDATSTLSLSVTQPLLSGAGRRIVEEPLTQAERDLVYEVRSFERFRRTFAVDVASRVYRLLQQIDAVANEQSNFDNLVLIRRRNEALAQAGRLSDIQVDQASQDELRSSNRLLDQGARLGLQIDELKLFLGLPIEVELGLDPAELEGLVAQERAALELSEEEAVAFALGHRLDYLTALDQVDDSRRRVRVAADALRAGLDLAASASAPSKPGKPARFNAHDASWGVGLDLELPVAKLPERNAYRATQIALEATRRNSEQLSDGIRVDLREALRDLEATREAYQIQENAVLLAERRVESARLKMEAGRADTRDILEAQEALLEAQNAATGALIDYTLARLALYRDMELLRVDASGIAIDAVQLSTPDESEDSDGDARKE